MADVQVRSSAGVVVDESGMKVVLDDGTRVTPLWPAHWTPFPGDRVQCLVVDGTAHILGAVTSAPRPISGTVAGAASSGRIPITTDAGTVQARYAGTAPSIGTLVAIVWQGTTALLLPGTLAPIATDPSAVSAPPPSSAPTGPGAGTLLVAATGSGTWRTGSWGWASSTDVLQGTWGSGQENRGGWWYGDAPRALAGRTITGFRIRLGARLRIGSYNATATAHLYRTTNTTRPGADFSRVAGPHDISLPAGAGPGWQALPAAWGQALVDGGGGVGILGSPYLGVAGVSSDPASGQIALDWTR